jgi:hypothetical protein
VHWNFAPSWCCCVQPDTVDGWSMAGSALQEECHTCRMRAAKSNPPRGRTQVAADNLSGWLIVKRGACNSQADHRWWAGACSPRIPSHLFTLAFVPRLFGVAPFWTHSNADRTTAALV